MRTPRYSTKTMLKVIQHVASLSDEERSILRNCSVTGCCLILQDQITEGLLGIGTCHPHDGQEVSARLRRWKYTVATRNLTYAKVAHAITEGQIERRNRGEAA